MNPLMELPRATRHTAIRLASFREKLRFLRGNLRLSLFWPLAAMLVAAIGWSILLSELREDRREADRFALVESEALARNYADTLKRTLDMIDQLLLHVRLEWEVSKGSLQLESVKEQGLFPPSAPFNVAILDRSGWRLTSTIGKADDVEEPRNLSDRAFFNVHQGSAGDFLYISPPASGRVGGDQVIRFSRRLTDASGQFDGVALISVRADYFTANYDEVTLGRHGLLGMIGGDGIVRVTRSGDIVQGWNDQLLTGTVFFNATSGSKRGGPEMLADGRSRYLGWQIVTGYPFIALVGMDQQAVLAPYLAMRRASLRNAIGASAALAIFTLIATALSLRLAWRKYQMEKTQATYRMATEGGSEGFYICRPARDAQEAVVDYEVIDCNHRGADFFGMSREEFIGKRVTALYDRGAAERALSMLGHALESGEHEGELDVSGERGRKRCWRLKAVRSGTDLAVTLRDISHEKAHVRELERRGNEDALTGLPNRLWVQSYLPQALRSTQQGGQMLALLFIDLDGFKAVNDSMGHAAGDELLRNAARRLKDAVRPHDNVVRFGGDEFIVILERVPHQEDAAHVAQRVLHAFEEDFRLSQGTASVGTSIGISIYPKDAQNADSLLQHADIAMYSVKTAGKRHFRFFDSGFYEALRARLERETELRRAIERDEFLMYYQPRIDMATGRTSGMEALVRWQHPTRGLVDPVEFIPLAEDTGMITALGGIVIDKVCRQLAAWGDAGQYPVPVSVNVSPRQFSETDMVQTFSSALARHGVSAQLIEMELTESTMMGNTEAVSAALGALHDMGIKLLVDDFGTGYSSLSQLQRLDFDLLKVDRAFTAQIGKSDADNVFFTAIITMAHALGMRVVAEGVENRAQLDLLRTLRCDEIQGFYISRPLPPGQAQPIMSTRLLSEIA